MPRIHRRNVEILGYCSFDSRSRYTLGFHRNHNPRIDGFAINRDAARIGDMGAREPFRKYARFWLAGDDLRAGRGKYFQTPRHQNRARRPDRGALRRGRQVPRPWEDRWFEHSRPSMNDPRRAMCWLTPDGSLGVNTVARMYLKSNDSLLVLYEDRGLRVIRRPPNMHLLSTVGLLRGMQKVGVIPSADAIIDEMTNPTKPDRRSEDRRAPTDRPDGVDEPEAIGSYWTPSP